MNVFSDLSQEFFVEKQQDLSANYKLLGICMWTLVQNENNINEMCRHNLEHTYIHVLK